MNRLRFRWMRGTLLILGACLLIISTHGIQSQMSIAKKPVPEPEPPPPQAANLVLEANNIFTTQPFGHALEAWGTDLDPGTVPFWRADGVRYDSVAIGDVDGDGTQEVVAPNACGINRGVMIFLNAYKDNFDASGFEMGVWRSTFYDGASNNLEEIGTVIFNEVKLYDLDSDAKDEVIVMTKRWLAVYDYEPKAPYSYLTPDGQPGSDYGAFLKTAAVMPTVPGDDTEFRLMSMELLDIDGLDGMELMVTGWDYDTDQSYVFAYTFESGQLNLLCALPFSAVPSGRALAGGNLDTDGALEFCTAGYRRWRVRNKSYYEGFLFVWDDYGSGWAVHEYSLTGEVRGAPIHILDVGQLDDGADEIVLAFGINGESQSLQICNWDSSGGFEVTGNVMDLEPAWANHIVIEDLDENGTNEILLGGIYSDPNPDNGWLYLEIFDILDGSLVSQFSRKGGESNQSAIRYLAVGLK
ncbi:MAG: hypothetical protein WBB73_06765 [Candidatus Aminicenantaceae bacterium]